MTHKHHIIPKHAGGTNSPDNLIELSVEEHAEAHRILFEQYGRKEDELAWKGLAGIISKQEIIYELARDRMKGNKLCVGRYQSQYTIDKIKKNRKGKGTQLKSSETKVRMSEARFNYWLSKRLEDKSLYEVTTPTNQCYVLSKNDLFLFCNDNDLRFDKVLRGKTKGYKCVIIDGN